MKQKAYTRRGFIQAFSLPFFIPAVNVYANTPDIVKLADLLKKPDPLTWVFTGDSVTQGAHHTYGGRCYPEIIAERIRWELRRIADIVINSGVNGTNTKYLLGGFDVLINSDIGTICIDSNSTMQAIILVMLSIDKLVLPYPV